MNTINTIIDGCFTKDRWLFAKWYMIGNTLWVAISIGMLYVIEHGVIANDTSLLLVSMTVFVLYGIWQIIFGYIFLRRLFVGMNHTSS